jgi:hypothetical protein
MKNHPTSELLALYSAGDLAWSQRLMVAWHVRGCERCAGQARQYAEARAALRAASLELPETLDWEQLAAEMKANIRLGWTAGAIVGDAPVQARPVQEAAGWRVAVVLASLSFVVVAGWWLRTSAPVGVVPPTAAVVFDARPEGVALQQQDRAFTLLSPSAQPVTTTVNWDGGARARYVDAETGQVTLHHVYSE